MFGGDRLFALVMTPAARRFALKTVVDVRYFCRRNDLVRHEPETLVSASWIDMSENWQRLAIVLLYLGRTNDVHHIGS